MGFSNNDLKNITVTPVRVDFSLRKEVFFVTLGSLLGGLTMFLPRIFLDLTSGTQYYLIWHVFARILHTDSILAGVFLHFVVATIIGIITGLVLYKSNFLNVSKISNGLLYGIIAGMAVYLAFFIPIQEYVLEPTTVQVMLERTPSLLPQEALDLVEQNKTTNMLDAVFTHLIWGVTLGIISSVLTREFGANYRCNECQIEFSKLSSAKNHHKYRHEKPLQNTKHIVILGGGFGGVRVLRQIQNSLEDRIDVDISLVSEDNFFLFTPLLPEMATGMIEPRHIATPVRYFCKRARFYEAIVDSIDLQNNNVKIRRTYDDKTNSLSYNYLVLALGSRVNFFGNKNIEKHSFTIKTLGDAISIRNHLITMLENADQEENSNLQSKFLTFVVVGGGFSGVETVGEINDFVRDSVENYYRKINTKNIRIILLSASDGILPEVGSNLATFAFESLNRNGVEIITNCKVVDAGHDYVKLDNGKIIYCNTIVWAGGVAVDKVIQDLGCEHDEKKRVLVDEFLRVKNHENVYALGDCAAVTDPHSGKKYPPTAQHSLREAKIVAHNLTSVVKNSNTLIKFAYKTKGTMAKIGKRSGVALLMGHNVTGFLAWLLWRQYYLLNLPTREKKIRVALDWLIALFFKPDITKFRNIKEKNLIDSLVSNNISLSLQEKL